MSCPESSDQRLRISFDIVCSPPSRCQFLRGKKLKCGAWWTHDARGYACLSNALFHFSTREFKALKQALKELELRLKLRPEGSSLPRNAA
jgi:hypothetical protein